MSNNQSNRDFSNWRRRQTPVSSDQDSQSQAGSSTNAFQVRSSYTPPRASTSGYRGYSRPQAGPSTQNGAQARTTLTSPRAENPVPKLFSKSSYSNNGLTQVPPAPSQPQLNLEPLGSSLPPVVPQASSVLRFPRTAQGQASVLANLEAFKSTSHLPSTDGTFRQPLGTFGQGSAQARTETSRSNSAFRRPRTTLAQPLSQVQQFSGPTQQVRLGSNLNNNPARNYARRPCFNRNFNRDEAGRLVSSAPAPKQKWSMANQGTPVEQCNKKVRALLNKLTLKNFPSISSQILEKLLASQDSDQDEIAKAIFEMIFKKSLDEHTFCEIYAQLVKEILEKVAPPPEKAARKTKADDRRAIFRRYLLEQCQESFDTTWPAVNKEEANSIVGKTEEVTTSEPEMLTDAYYALEKVKRQRLGLVKLIGELFKLSIITAKIVDYCLRQLLAKNKGGITEADIECSCALLTKVGPKLGSEEATALRLDQYMQRLTEIEKEEAPSSRTKFMILDLIDSRSSGWTKK